MAAPSPWRWPLNFTNSPSLNYSSAIFPLYDRKRRRIVTWSSNSKSSSSSCRCSVNDVSNNVRKRVRKKAAEEIAIDSDSENNELASSSAKGGDVFYNKLSFKSLFGRRALWRRILFASQKVRSIILLNVITVIYASNIPVVKEVEAIIDPEVFTVMRFTVAAIPFIPFVLQARDDAHIRNAGIELGFWVSLGYILQALGLLTSDAGRASFISMFTVIVVPLIDGVLGSAVPARTWFGALMSIIGVAMLESSGSPPCVGDLLNFFSAVSFGIHMLRTEHISRSTKRENFLPLLGYEVCTVAVLSTIWYLIEGWFGGGIQELNPSSWTWEAILDWIYIFPWIPALYTGIFSTGPCLWVEMAAMCDVSATETAIIYGLEPVWGAGFAWFLLGERWGVGGWIGAALVLGGSLTVQIMGATSDSLTRECRKGNDFFISDEQNSLSTSPVVVNARKHSSDIIKNPDKLQSIQVLEGDGRSIGSVRLLTYVMGVPVIAKDKIVAVDEENTSITFELIGGEVTKYFKSFEATFQATAKADINIVKWILQYEKASEDVPCPHSHLEFLVNMSREIDAYLLKA